MRYNLKVLGHIAAFIAIFIWSIAFIGNKVLLQYLSPIDIMIFRFALAYLLMLIIFPKSLLPKALKDELFFFLIGFLGIFVYFLLENFALKYTQATNVGLYMGTIPIFTALVAHFLISDEKFSLNLLIGFIIAGIGIAMILLEGKDIDFRLLGDSLALLAAITFAIYSAILKTAPRGYHYITITRKSFFYALVLMLIYTTFIDKSIPNTTALSQPIVSINIFFLGLLASGLAFLLWNYAIKHIGSIASSNYIYLVPLITAICGVLILDEKLTPTMIFAGVLILVGLYISQRNIEI